MTTKRVIIYKHPTSLASSFDPKTAFIADLDESQIRSLQFEENTKPFELNGYDIIHAITHQETRNFSTDPAIHPSHMKYFASRVFLSKIPDPDEAIVFPSDNQKYIPSVLDSTQWEKTDGKLELEITISQHRHSKLIYKIDKQEVLTLSAMSNKIPENMYPFITFDLTGKYISPTIKNLEKLMAETKIKAKEIDHNSFKSRFAGKYHFNSYSIYCKAIEELASRTPMANSGFYYRKEIEGIYDRIWHEYLEENFDKLSKNMHTQFSQVIHGRRFAPTFAKTPQEEVKITLNALKEKKITLGEEQKQKLGQLLYLNNQIEQKQNLGKVEAEERKLGQEKLEVKQLRSKIKDLNTSIKDTKEAIPSLKDETVKKNKNLETTLIEQLTALGIPNHQELISQTILAKEVKPFIPSF